MQESLCIKCEFKNTINVGFLLLFLTIKYGFSPYFMLNYNGINIGGYKTMKTNKDLHIIRVEDIMINP